MRLRLLQVRAHKRYSNIIIIHKYLLAAALALVQHAPRALYYTLFTIDSCVSFPLAAEKELVEFLAEEIVAEKKALKLKTIPTELEGFKVSLDGAEVRLTKQQADET